MKIDGKRQFELLEKMSFVRMGGTDEEMAAANILMDEIKAMGLEPVIEEFEIEDAELIAGELEVLALFVTTMLSKHVTNTASQWHLQASVCSIININRVGDGLPDIPLTSPKYGTASSTSHITKNVGDGFPVPQ